MFFTKNFEDEEKGRGGVGGSYYFHKNMNHKIKAKLSKNYVHELIIIMYCEKKNFVSLEQILENISMESNAFHQSRKHRAVFKLIVLINK